MVLPELSLWRSRRSHAVDAQRAGRRPAPRRALAAQRARLASFGEQRAAARRPASERVVGDRQRDRPRGVRARGGERGRGDPRRGGRQGRRRARGHRRRRRRRTIPPRSSARCGRSSRRASASAAARPRRRSSAPARSCWCAATAPAWRPSRWPARPAEAPIPPSTITSASSCAPRPRTARSTRSSSAGSSARCARTPSGSRPAAEPSLVKVANIQHLATPIRAQLSDAALGGRAGGPAAPDAGRRRRAPRCGAGGDRPSSRAWTAAGTRDRWAGWTPPRTASSASALRSGLLRDRVAHLFAGNGIVADSDPAAELAETELKLGALLPLLAG